MSKGNNAKKFAVGALLAGVAGYVAGILTAPKSGEETRDDIKDAAVQTKAQAEKQLKELHAEINDLVTKGKTQAGEVKDKAKSDIDEAMGKAGVTKQQIKEVLSAVRNGEADDPQLKRAIKDAKNMRDHLKKYIKND